MINGVKGQSLEVERLKGKDLNAQMTKCCKV